MKRSLELQNLIADLHDPDIVNDPPAEITVDPATKAVRQLTDPVEMRIFLKAYAKGMFKNDMRRLRHKEGLVGSLVYRRETKRMATIDAVGYILTKALDSSPNAGLSDNWFSVAERSGLWPLPIDESPDILEDDLFEDFRDL